MTFDELAEQTGMAKTTVLNYLNGKRDIPMGAFAELCRALGASQVEIFTIAQKSVK